ncbi:hypothetical protein [Alkalisalibacterium limincola]|uniref:DUF998 domain-containing protein n=1 Tax=Alkalisalibacterium limincola TaxID=2699169 RepID=A0A5C8KI53_9GAMM|nr:hypothetical protein [Alkalisalibacterium limincola]TXK59155.1 hypothetical protein FU658_13615 [Alkalisalibacterium limincola]
MGGPTLHRNDVALWPLALMVATLPAIATHVAWALSLHAGHIPWCVPYLEGCTSISRAARHGLGNDLFRMVMLPTAALQALFWVAVAAWLRSGGARVAATVPWLGLLAAVFLALYATFLGSEGDIYRMLRRYGVTVYFAATYLALLASLRALQKTRGARDPGYRPLLVVALGMLALGVLSTAATAFVDSRELKDRIENVLEWHLGVWLTAMFLVVAWRWWREGVRVGLR